MKKCLSILIVLVGLYAFGTANAQEVAKMRMMTPESTKKKNDTPVNASDTNKSNSASRHSQRSIAKRQPIVERADSQAYYTYVERRNGWIKGKGNPVSAKKARHLPVCFRMSRPNDRGHWQQVELMGKGCTTSGLSMLAPYWDCHYPGLTPKAEEWMRQSRTAAIWHQTAGPDGDELLEERACDAQGTLLFTTLYTPLEDNSVNLAFTDRQGFPIDVNPAGREIELEAALDIVHQESFDNTYGTTVLILRDASGRDSLVTLRDGQGYLKSRADGVTTLKFIRDSLGRTVYELSLNICDEPVLRRSGFCGWHYEYDGTSNTPTHSVKVGTDLKPLGWAEGKGLTVQSAH